VNMDERGFLIVLTPRMNILTYEQSDFVSANRDYYQSFRKTFAEFDPCSYKGIARQPFSAETLTRETIRSGNFREWERPSNKARIRMFELLEEKITCDLVEDPYYADLFDRESDAREVLSMVENPRDYEIVEARISEFESTPGSLGYDLGYWGGEAYSLIADTLVTPMWHPAPEECYERMRAWYRHLNENLLFGAASDAAEFREYYTAQNWAEREPDGSGFPVIQVLAVDSPAGEKVQRRVGGSGQRARTTTAAGLPWPRAQQSCRRVMSLRNAPSRLRLLPATATMRQTLALEDRKGERR
jgi:hypothetical protein